MMINSLSIS